MSRHCLDIIFSPILKNSGKKLIFLKNNCFRVSHMGCEARFLSLMVFLSFPQLNFIFRASILNCTAAFFARFRYFQTGCTFHVILSVKVPRFLLPLLEAPILNDATTVPGAWQELHVAGQNERTIVL